jgi:GNAT superfamily N-acetyltransferase
MVYFHIKSVEDQRELLQLEGFLHSQQLWYPDYHDWVKRTSLEIDSGYKQAIVAWGRRGDVLGDMVFQPHKQLPKTMELKNMRVNPNFRREGLASFLIRQAESEARKQGFERCIADADSRLKDVAGMMRYLGYQVIMSQSLYTEDNLDLVFTKELAA